MTRLPGLCMAESRAFSNISRLLQGLVLLVVSLQLVGCGSAAPPDYYGRWRGHTLAAQLRDRQGNLFDVAALRIEVGTTDTRANRPFSSSMAPVLGETTLVIANADGRTIALATMPVGTFIELQGKIVNALPMTDPTGKAWLGPLRGKGGGPALKPEYESQFDPDHPNIFPDPSVRADTPIKILAPATAPSATEQK